MSDPTRILYIDDYLFDRELVLDALEQEHGGFHVTMATTRAEFEQALTQESYDLVLSDFNILGFEGLQVLATVQAYNPELPVVIVTGTGSEEIAAEAIKRGAADYVIKNPQHIRRLPLTIQAVIARQLVEREQRAALRQRIAELEAVSRIAFALRAAQTSDTILPVMLDETLAAIEADSGIIWIAQPGAGMLRVAVARGCFAALTGATLAVGEGLAGSVFASGAMREMPDSGGNLPLSAADHEQIPPGWRTFAVPLRTSNEVVGVLLVAQAPPHTLTGEQRRLLVALAEMAGATIHRLHLHEETARRLRHLQALQAIDRVMIASLDRTVILNVLLEQVTAQLAVDAAGVLLFDPQLHALKYAAGRGLHDPGYQRAHVPLGEGLAGRAALERRLLQAFNGAAHSDPVRAPLLRNQRFNSYLAAPFIAKGQLKGVLEIFHRHPLRPDAEWLAALRTFADQAAIAMDNLQLFESLQRSNLDLILAYDTTIEGWSRALDLRDQETEGHTMRVTELTMRIVHAAGFSEEQLVHVRRGALLHDIGKMGIPDAILLKPGPLTEEEWAIMRRHPTYAYELLAPITYLRPALDIPYCHHEKWDGSGYPRGLRGEAIPLAARIFAVVDVWDALRSDRPYRQGWPDQRIVEHIRAQSGSHFAPGAVELFFMVLNDRRYQPPSSLGRGRDATAR
jgi:response regulator RpfG family c-di-GMP phosphodiesterase